MAEHAEPPVAEAGVEAAAREPAGIDGIGSPGLALLTAGGVRRPPLADLGQTGDISDVLLSLQRTAGNRAVTRVVAQARGPVLARQNGHPPGPSGFHYAEIGEPESVITDLPRVLQIIAGITLDAEARQAGVADSILHPTIVVVYTESHYVILRPNGTPIDVIRQNGMHPLMLPWRVAYLEESHSGGAWFYGTQDGHPRIQSFRHLGTEAIPSAAPGESTFRVFMPGSVMPADLVESLQRRVRGGEAAGGIAGWARAAVEAARRRRGGAGTSGTGPGAGQSGRGPGGGGQSETETGDGGAPPPLQGTPRLEAVEGASGTPQLRITLDRARTTLPLREGEAPAALDARIDAAIAQLQASRDPSRHEGLATPQATQTGFAPPAGGEAGTAGTAEAAQAQAASTPGATTPEERVPGAAGGANAPAYPATITMAGSGPDAPPPVTVIGASNSFTMNLNYAARSLGFQDEVFNRLQPVQFYWELIDVTGLTQQQARDRSARTAAGAGQAEGPGSGAGRAIARDLEDIGRDQEADLRMMSDEDWPWEARAAYLGVIGLSNSVRVIGSLISSYVAIITEPLNERSIGFTRGGDFLIRCVATPQASDEARADPAHHVLRASSTAVLPIRVEAMSTRAATAADRESTELATLEARLREAEASGDQHRIADARARLEAARRAGRMSAFDLLSANVAAARERVRVAERLQANVTAGRAESTWELPELELQIALVSRRMTIDQYLPAARAELAQIAGEHGEHLTWVTGQHDRMQAIGGQRDFRPRVALASQETGQVNELRLMLGRVSGPNDARARWSLVDITSPASRDVYQGESSLAGHEGQVAAIRDCFRRMAESGAYGRGTLAIRLPAELGSALGQPVSIEASMQSQPGNRARALQRLRDLATVAEVAGLFATGGLGVAIGAVGGIAGAVGSVDSLARRARTGHLLEVDTVFDILGVVGGVASVGSVATHIARDAAEAGRAAGRLPSWVNRVERAERVLEIHGTLGNVQQVISIPYQLVTELNSIDADTSLSQGQRDARRALSFLNALRSGAVTIVQASGGLASDEHAPRAGERHEELGPGFRAGEAGSLAEGSGHPLPPVHDTPRAQRRADEGPQPAAHPEPVAGPSPEELVARARELARLRLGEATETTTRIAEGEAEGEGRTAAGTARPGPEAHPTAGADANAAERTRAVELLGERVGALRPPVEGPHPPPPPIGAYGERTRSGQEAVGTYDRAVAVAPGREVGLFYNPNTGEFAVRIGTESEVHGPPGDGWHALIHMHPNPENVVIRRLPAPADIMGAVRAALRGGSHVEFVQSGRPDGTTGLARVEVTMHPQRIVVELPAEPGEPARRIEVTTPDEYARQYGSETTHLDPTSPLYAWVVRDLDAYYAARRADADYGGEPGGRTAAGTASSGGGTGTTAAPAAPSFRSRLMAGRQDVQERFAAADQAHTDAGRPPPPPSVQFDMAMAALERSGLSEPGRRMIEEMFQPARGREQLSANRFGAALEELRGLLVDIQTRPDFLGETGARARYESLVDMANDVLRAYRLGETIEGNPIQLADSPQLAQAMARMRAALAEYRNAANTDPIERLIRLRRLREEIILAQETLRNQETGRFTSSTTPGATTAASTLLGGVQETTIEATARGQVNEGLLRGAPGSSLEGYMTSAGGLGELPGVSLEMRQRLAALLEGYHRAHMIGPGFGGELFEGMMMAPAVVNLRAQNRGVEQFVRDMAAGGGTVTVETHATGRRLIVPTEGGGTVHVDILTSIEYRIRVGVRGETRDYRVVIGVTDPPRGRPMIVVNTIPADTPGGAMLSDLGG